MVHAVLKVKEERRELPVLRDLQAHKARKALLVLKVRRVIRVPREHKALWERLDLLVHKVLREYRALPVR